MRHEGVSELKEGKFCEVGTRRGEGIVALRGYFLDGGS
jgi:hypothetical protein